MGGIPEPVSYTVFLLGMQMIVSALPDVPRPPSDSAVQRLLVEGAQKLDLRVQASVKAEAEVLYG